MTIDIRKIKVGDYVTVRAKVISIDEDAPGEFNVAPDTDRHRQDPWIWILSSAITGHEPAPEPAPEPLKVGDVVTYDLTGERYTIIGLYNKTAWLECFGSPWGFLHVRHLRRVES